MDYKEGGVLRHAGAVPVCMRHFDVKPKSGKNSSVFKEGPGCN